MKQILWVPWILGGISLVSILVALNGGNPALATKTMVIVNIARYIGGLTLAFFSIFELRVDSLTIPQQVRLIAIAAISAGIAVIPPYDFPYAFENLWK